MGLGSRGATYGKFLSDESFTVDEITADSLTPPPGARSALITVSGNGALYRFGGQDPVGAGHTLSDGGNIEVFAHDLVGFRIAGMAGDPTDVFVSYFAIV